MIVVCCDGFGGFAFDVVDFGWVWNKVCVGLDCCVSFCVTCLLF